MEDAPEDLTTLRTTLRETVFRALYVARYGVARTLRERLAQEGAVLARAGGGLAGREPAFDPEEIARSRAVVRPHLDSTDKPTAMSLLFGDPAAWALGYSPAGLTRWAGLNLAWHDARAASTRSSTEICG